MKNRWLLTLIALLVMFSLVLAGCAPPKPEEPVAEEPGLEESMPRTPDSLTLFPARRRIFGSAWFPTSGC